MGVGRFFCVLLPFALTVASVIFLLVGTLAGVTGDKSLYLFEANVTNLSIDPVNAENIIDNLRARTDIKTDNITAADLGLNKVYDISIWGYCYTDQDNKRHCTKPKYNWASSALNTSYLENFGAAAGVEIELPKEIKDSLKAFKEISKWTEIAYVIAFIALGVELVLGIFANCSRIMSCCTWIVSGIAAALVCAAAGMSTAMAAVVVGAIESTAKYYGVKGKINTSFLAIVWIAAAFAIGASMFWIFTICCCAPNHSSGSSRKNRRSDGEKLLPGGANSGGAYAPLGNDHEMTSGGGYYNQNQSASQYGAPRYPSGAARSDLAYEPYSHRA